MAPTISHLIAQYPILRELSRFISTLDLFHLALSCHEFYAYILSSSRVFDALKRESICDGNGLRDRQNFQGLYRHRPSYVWGKRRKIWEDEPIEVRLWGTQCDAAGALPCRKCGINICEECRWYPREPPRRSYPNRRPHLNGPWQNENVMCLCNDCDEKLEEELKGHFLNELCDCDIYKRWICSKCVGEERSLTNEHYAKNTASEVRDERYYEDVGKTKSMTDHQFDILFYCPCGAYVPQDARPRCIWCKRKHLPESEWYREYEEVGSKLPFFDDDPCYPPYIGDIYADCCDRPYPKLKYDGPIHQVPERTGSCVATEHPPQAVRRRDTSVLRADCIAALRFAGSPFLQILFFLV